jgi:hypothetical protein
MNDMARRKLPGPGHDGPSGRASAVAIVDSPALRQDRWPAAAMDRPVDSASSEQRRVRRVDDRIDGLFRDVPLEERDPYAVDHRPGSRIAASRHGSSSRSRRKAPVRASALIDPIPNKQGTKGTRRHHPVIAFT